MAATAARRMSRWFSLAALCAALGCSDSADSLHPFVVRACKCEDRECARAVVRDLRAVVETGPRARGNLASVEDRIETLDKCRSRFGVTSGIEARVPARP